VPENEYLRWMHMVCINTCHDLYRPFSYVTSHFPGREITPYYWRNLPKC
jgi:hypothetical protein